jgi:hypothetical protein
MQLQIALLVVLALVVVTVAVLALAAAPAHHLTIAAAALVLGCVRLLIGMARPRGAVMLAMLALRLLLAVAFAVHPVAALALVRALWRLILLRHREGR